MKALGERHRGRRSNVTVQGWGRDQPRWVKHDKVSLDVSFYSALGPKVRVVDVWLYGDEEDLGGQLASRLALPGEKDERARA